VDRSFVAASCAARLRLPVNILQNVSSTLLDCQLGEEAGELLDLAVELEELRLKLIQLTTKSRQPAATKDRGGRLKQRDLPF
jgi:hypothetical protein